MSWPFISAGTLKDYIQDNITKQLCDETNALAGVTEHIYKLLPRRSLGIVLRCKQVCTIIHIPYSIFPWYTTLMGLTHPTVYVFTSLCPSTIQARKKKLPSIHSINCKYANKGTYKDCLNVSIIHVSIHPIIALLIPLSSRTAMRRILSSWTTWSLPLWMPYSTFQAGHSPSPSKVSIHSLLLQLPHLITDISSHRML